MPRVHGVNLSPYVRKVRVVLAEKGIDYELVPVVPFGISADFRKISPLGKIPVFEEDDGFTLPDSSVIVGYLERAYPASPVYPADPRALGQALFLEEYADTKLMEAVAPVFFERFVAVNLLQREPDEALIREAIEERQPPVFDWLSEQVAGREFAIGDAFSIADAALASPFVNLRVGGVEVDAARWPELDRYLKRIWQRPSYAALLEEEAQGAGH